MGRMIALNKLIKYTREKDNFPAFELYVLPSSVSIVVHHTQKF